MAEVFLSAFLPTVFDKLASQALLQYGKLWGVEKQLQKLESKLSAIRAVLQDAEEKQAKDMALRDWLAKLKDAAYDAEDVLDEFHTEAMRREAVNSKGQKVRTFVSKRIFSLFRIRIARKIEDIVERLNDIAEEKKSFHLMTSDGDAAFNRQIGTAIRPPTHSIGPPSVVGREEDKRKISELLVSDGRKELSVVPIVGIGGLGKTTLAQMVYNDKTVAEYFELRIWVCVSEDFDVQKLSKAIIESATDIKCELPSMDSLQRRLRELLSSKRFLLVLDDVWNEDQQKWHDLKRLITVGSEGSAVLVTTRSHKVSSIMRTGYDHRLGRLSEEDCWTLFKGRAFEGSADIEEHPNLVPLGKAIVSKCGGSPLAANSLGGLMRFKREEWEWKAVIESKMWELQEDQVMASLKLSYNNLHPQLKQCFALCAIFPKDYEIDRDMLIQLWMAHGFIPFDGRTELELKGREIFNELELTSFFQEISERMDYRRGLMKTTCKMHDLVHDLACSILGNECLTIVSREESIDADRRKVRHLFVNCSMEDGDINGLNISQCTRTLLFSEGYGIYHKGTLGSSQTDWSKAMYLRCLNLRAIGFGLSKVPNSVCNLKHLRYLDLSCNSFESLPEAICSLFNLQTLKLSRCHKLCELPKGMRKMTSLRHLYLDGCSDLKCMPTRMGQLKCLQTLTAYILAKDDGSGSIGELGSLNNIGGLLQLCNLEHVRSVAEAEEAKLGGKQKLQSLELNWRWSESESGDGLAAADIDEQVLEALRPHHNLKRLAIRSYRGTRLPMWLMEDSIIFKYLVEISLDDCNRCECLPQLGTLPLLEVLLIEGLHSVKRIGGSQFYGSDGAVVFPSLRKFFMCYMYELEEWSEVEEDRPSFPHLVDLEITWCPGLATIPGHLSPQSLAISYCPLLLPPPQWSLGNMKRLNKLTLRYSDNMALMWGQDDDDDDDHEGTTSLVELEIQSNSDQTMFSSRYLRRLNKFCSLETLKFRDCAGLVSLPIETIQTLSSLKILRIYDCSNLRGHLPLQCLISLACLAIKRCDELESLQFPESVREVTIRSCPQIMSFPEGLGCLSRLESLDLRELVNLASLPEGMECLEALKSLAIEGCPLLTSLPIGLQQCLPNLTQLRIWGSPDLVKRCKRDGGEYWPLISNIPGLSIGE